ncbi:MAG: ACP S-malonyltransferase [Bdellovibrionales bacterium]|nr:ACP S-malonyltransferase [Bdellovibrionales bacterium]
MKAGFFPGQGSQSVGMGKLFYDEFTVFRQTIEEASDTLGFNFKKLLFEGPDGDLTLTENAQPAILAVSTGCFRVAEAEIGMKTDVNLGHSLGEYSALVACDAIDFSNAIAWVRERGLAMQKAVPIGEGTMSAILGGEDAQIETWCKEATALAKSARADGAKTATGGEWSVTCSVEPANYNAQGQIVVSGSIDAVAALETLITNLKIRGVMAKRLNVSAPFHSSLMKPARDKMESIFATATKPTILATPYIPNRTANITHEPGVIHPLLSEQVDHSVLWKQSVETLLQSGCKKAFEFGPGKVLQGLAKRIAKTAGAEFETYPIYDLESLKLAEGALKS